MGLKWNSFGANWSYTVVGDRVGDGCPLVTKSDCVAKISGAPREQLTLLARPPSGQILRTSISISVRSLVILGGQSNAEGAESYVYDSASGQNFLTMAEQSSADQATQLTWLPWLVTPQPKSQSGFVPLNTPQSIASWLKPNSIPIFGPELGLGRRFYASRGYGLSIIKAAFPNTSLARDWSPSLRNGIFEVLTRKIQSVVASDAKSGIVDLYRGIVWFQGESDAMNLAYADKYHDNLRNFLTSLEDRAKVPLETTIAIVEPSLNDFIALRSMNGACGDCTLLAQGNMEVRSAEETLAEENSQICLVDSDGLPRSTVGLHLSNTAEIAVGQSVSDCFTNRQIG